MTHPIPTRAHPAFARGSCALENILVVTDLTSRWSFSFRPSASLAPPRAADAAALHGPDARAGKGHEGKHGTGGDHGLQAIQLPPANAKSDPTDTGARIELTPRDPEDLTKLRERIRQRAESMMASCH